MTPVIRPWDIARIQTHSTWREKGGRNRERVETGKEEDKRLRRWEGERETRLIGWEGKKARERENRYT